MRTVAEVMIHLTRTSKIATRKAKSVSSRESFAVAQVQAILTELSEMSASSIAEYGNSDKCDNRDKSMLRWAWKIANQREMSASSEALWKSVKPVSANKRKSAAVVPSTPQVVRNVEWFVTINGAAVRFDAFAPAHAFFVQNENFGAKRPVKVG